MKREFLIQVGDAYLLRRYLPDEPVSDADLLRDQLKLNLLGALLCALVSVTMLMVISIDLLPLKVLGWFLLSASCVNVMCVYGMAQLLSAFRRADLSCWPELRQLLLNHSS